MANPDGRFIWYELMTTDPDAASQFYGAVVGWSIPPEIDPGAGGMDYRMIKRDHNGFAGGMLGLTDAMIAGGARPCWLPYLHVTDVDAAITSIVAGGGKLQMPAMDLPVGRVAMIADPQGVPIYIMTPIPPEGRPDATSDVFSETEVQRVNWNELTSPDQAGSKSFYANHFGFEFNESMPMGPMGSYDFIDHHGARLGAIVQRTDGNPPLWLLYFGVPSIAEAKRTVEADGGKVLMGPHEVPGGNWIIVALDPQGVGFGLVGPKGD